MSTTVAPISFARGAPSLDIVDVDGLRESAQNAFTQDPGGSFGYGTAVGYVPLRDWIAEQHDVAAERVIVTNGSMQADAFLFDELVSPGDAVVVEEPTYDRTLLSLRDRGADIHPVALEADGIDVDALERLLESGVRPKLAHIIPNFQNPAGHTLSRAKRERLIELAGGYDFVLFEDDPYVHLRFSGDTLPTMLAMAGDDGPVVYASSFSKTICPGIRTGYLVGPEERMVSVRKRAVAAYIAPNMVAESIVNEFCRSGAIVRSIETVKDALRERMTALCDGLEEQIPDARFVRPEGGYFLWVDLPDGVRCDALFEAAAERGVQIVKGSDFQLEGGEGAMRLAYSGVTVEQVQEGVGRLAEAVRSLQA